MNLAVVSTEDFKKLLEHQRALQDGQLRIDSFEDAKQRFENIILACETTLHMCEDAYVTLEEDDLDGFEEAKAKADKMEKLEREHDRCIAAWEAQLRRLNWEARELKKLPAV
jgi:hypothetical protein